MPVKFGLIGDGKIAFRHKHAININGGVVYKLYDPKYNDACDKLDDNFFDGLDYVTICSPSFLHREHIKLCLKHSKKIITEKPMALPWEPLIDNNDINIVLQLRWMDLPDKACLVKSVMIRDEDYFKLWEGDPKKTGGLFYHLFIHYIDLAIQLGAGFEGLVKLEGEQIRVVDDIDIMKLDMNDLYAKMYNDIINHNKGVKPNDIFYLHWLLDRTGNSYGLGTNILNNTIRIENNLL